MAANNYSFNTAYSFFAGILIAIVGMVMFGFFWEPVPVVETKVDSDHPYR
jgi:H+/gluconate symporter-like permease